MYYKICPVCAVVTVVEEMCSGRVIGIHGCDDSLFKTHF